MIPIDKNRVIALLEVLAVLMYGLLTIATCSAVWNSKPVPTLSVFAGLLMLANGFVIYRSVKELKKRNNL